MSSADSNRVSLGIAPETVPGIIDDPVEFQALRITGTPNLAFTPVTVTTDELRPDRQVTDLILVGAEAGGDAGFELSASALDTIISGAQLNPWTRRNNRVNGDVTDITGQVITLVAGTAFVIGDLIALNGFGDANDDFIFANTTATTTDVTAAAGLIANAAAASTAEVRNVGVEGATGDVETAVSPNSLTSSTLDFTTLGLTAGQWIKIGGSLAANAFATVAVNDWVRIVGTPTANEIVLDVVPASWAADAGAGQDIWLFFGDYVRNGVTLVQHTLERRFTDITVFEYFVGMAVNTLNFQLSAQSIVTATAGFLGFNATIGGVTTSNATTLAAPTENVVNTSSNVGRIGRGGTPIVGPNFVLEATMAINNNLRRQNAVGSLGAIGVGIGEYGVTGTLNTLFGDTSLLLDVLNNTETSLDFRFDGGTSILTTKRTVLFDMPRVKYSSGAPSVPGKNEDVVQNLGYQALRHPVLDYTLGIQQFHGIQI